VWSYAAELEMARGSVGLCGYVLDLAAKGTYYLNCKTGQASISALQLGRVVISFKWMRPLEISIFFVISTLKLPEQRLYFAEDLC
jgi:hypothetical protein